MDSKSCRRYKSIVGLWLHCHVSLICQTCAWTHKKVCAKEWRLYTPGRKIAMKFNSKCKMPSRILTEWFQRKSNIHYHLPKCLGHIWTKGDVCNKPTIFEGSDINNLDPGSISDFWPKLQRSSLPSLKMAASKDLLSKSPDALSLDTPAGSDATPVDRNQTRKGFKTEDGLIYGQNLWHTWMCKQHIFPPKRPESFPASNWAPAAAVGVQEPQTMPLGGKAGEVSKVFGIPIFAGKKCTNFFWTCLKVGDLATSKLRVFKPRCQA